MRDSGNVQRAEHPNGRALSKLSARDLVPGEERGSTQCDRVKEPARLDALPASSLKCAARALRLHPALRPACKCKADCASTRSRLAAETFFIIVTLSMKEITIANYEQRTCRSKRFWTTLYTIESIVIGLALYFGRQR